MKGREISVDQEHLSATLTIGRWWARQGFLLERTYESGEVVTLGIWDTELPALIKSLNRRLRTVRKNGVSL